MIDFLRCFVDVFKSLEADLPEKARKLFTDVDLRFLAKKIWNGNSWSKIVDISLQAKS